MKEVSNLFAEEQLSPPAVLPWPLSGAAEDDRRRRELSFRAGLAADPPPGLAWISGHAESKYDPSEVLPGCRSVLVTGLGYYREDPEDSENPAGAESPRPGEGPRGKVARYARGRDYHRELGGRLKRIARKLEEIFPEHRFRAFTDIGPLDETWLAEASGLGFKGRHTLAILPDFGSWAVLGHIVTTLPMEGSPEASPGGTAARSCPENCRRCIDACPTGALSMPGVLDAGRCISCRSIEHRGPTEPELRQADGDRLFGCDACQEACPFNARAVLTGVPAFLKDIAGASVDLREILSLESHEDVVRRFAGSPLMRAGRAGLVRNALTAAGNSGNAGLLPAVERLLDDEDEGVRDHARWAAGRLGFTRGKPSRS